MSTVDKIVALRQQYLAHHAEGFDSCMNLWCESPIEQLFVAALLVEFWDSPTQDRYSDIHAWRQMHRIEMHAGTLVPPSSPCGAFLLTQASLSVDGRSYRLDAVLALPDEKYAIEFDGHEFHERTKEQAERDKSRDRALTLAGWKVLRFTGSEIHRDPNEAVRTLERVCHAGDARHEERTRAALGKPRLGRA